MLGLDFSPASSADTEGDLNLARVVGRRSRKPSKTVNVPSNVTNLCFVSPGAWLGLLYRAGRKHDLSLILLRKRREQVPKILDLFRLPALQKLSTHLEIAGNVIETHEHAGEFNEP